MILDGDTGLWSPTAGPRQEVENVVASHDPKPLGFFAEPIGRLPRPRATREALPATDTPTPVAVNGVKATIRADPAPGLVTSRAHTHRPPLIGAMERRVKPSPRSLVVVSSTVVDVPAGCAALRGAPLPCEPIRNSRPPLANLLSRGR